MLPKPVSLLAPLLLFFLASVEGAAGKNKPGVVRRIKNAWFQPAPEPRPPTFLEEVQKVCTGELTHTALRALSKKWKTYAQTIMEYDWDAEMPVADLVVLKNKKLQELIKLEEVLDECMQCYGDIERRLFRILKDQAQLQRALRERALYLASELPKVVEVPKVWPNSRPVESCTIGGGLLSTIAHVAYGDKLIADLACLVVFGNAQCNGLALPPLPSMEELLDNLASRLNDLTQTQRELHRGRADIETWYLERPRQRLEEYNRLVEYMRDLEDTMVVADRSIRLIEGNRHYLVNPIQMEGELKKLRGSKKGFFAKLRNLIPSFW